MDGLQRLLDFLSSLQDKGITYTIHHFAPDNITVIATLVGARLEFYFDVRGMTYSVFKGSEAVEDDRVMLDAVFSEHWSDEELNAAHAKSRDADQAN